MLVMLLLGCIAAAKPTTTNCASQELNAQTCLVKTAGSTQINYCADYTYVIVPADKQSLYKGSYCRDENITVWRTK